MSSGSRDLASDFTNDFLSEDEIFSMPIVDAPGGDEFGIGDSAGVSPLRAVLQPTEREMLEDLEAFLNNDENTAQGMGVHAEAARLSALQPEYAQRRVEMRPNAGGQLAALARDAPALPGHMITCERRSVNHDSPLVRPRRAPGRSIPDAAPAPAAPGGGPQRWRPRVDVPNAGGSIFNRRPVGQTAEANPVLIVEDFPSVLRHPFHASITPVVYSFYRARMPQAPSIRAHCQTFSAPAIDSTAVTTVRSPIPPVQEQGPLQSTAVDVQYELPPMNLEEMECQPINLDHLSFDQTTTMSSAYGNHAHEALQEPMDIEYAPVMNADLGCQVEFYNQSSSTITAHDPFAQQAERVLVGRNHGPALGSDLAGQVIDIGSSSASSGCTIQDMDPVWGLSNSIDPPAADHSPERAAPQAEPNNAEIFRNPRLTWTPELVSRFEVAIELLGGPSKATPKAIVRCMACPQVTILNVKSRLQKFRLQAGMEVDTSRGTMRSHASTVTPDFKILEDYTIDTGSMMVEVYETCKTWSEQLEAQSLHLRHLLALHHMRTEAAKHNAMVLEEYAARTSAQLENPQPRSDHLATE